MTPRRAAAQRAAAQRAAARRAAGQRRSGTAIAFAAALATAVTATGCATFSADGGFGPVEQSARERLGKEVVWSRSDADRDLIAERVEALLARPLGADEAVQVALLNHRGLQAAFQELGIAEADVVGAGRLPNPGFSFGRLTRGDEVEYERGIHFNLARLIAMPLIGPIEARRFEQTRQRVTMTMLDHAADTRLAFYDAVAAEEAVRFAARIRQAADASAELARRMAQVGNFTRLQRAREQSFQADALLNLARAEQARIASRERLTRLLGLWGPQTSFRLPERLPDLPAAPEDAPDIERTGLATRLDVQAARLGAEQTARNLGLTRTTRFINVLELGLVSNRSNQAPTQRGWEVAFELPLFDWSGSRVARAEAIYRQALDRAADAAITARSEIREAYGAYRSAYDIARYYRDEVVPLRNRIAEENLLRYNGMLIGVFDLLADARAQIAGVQGYLGALHAFWSARARLDRALVGRPGSSADGPGTSVSAAAGTPADAGGAH